LTNKFKNTCNISIHVKRISLHFINLDGGWLTSLDSVVDRKL
jgi:hypothetical protein